MEPVYDRPMSARPITISSEHKRRLEAYAVRTGRTMQEILREAIDEYERHTAEQRPDDPSNLQR